MAEKVTRTLRIEKELDEHLLGLAVGDRRSVNNYVEFLIVAEWRRQNIQPKKGGKET